MNFAPFRTGRAISGSIKKPEKREIIEPNFLQIVGVEEGTTGNPSLATVRQNSSTGILFSHTHFVEVDINFFTCGGPAEQFRRLLAGQGLP